MSESDSQKSERRGIREGVRQGLGVLTALKEALEETIGEARERGDLSPDRAKQAVKSALDRAQEAAGEARERFDFVTRRELDDLVRELAELRDRISVLEGSAEVEAGEGMGGEAGREGGGDGPGT